MTPLVRLRVEKAAADCGFEMTAIPHPDGLELRSALFPQTVRVRVAGGTSFDISASDLTILGPTQEEATLRAQGYAELYGVLRAAAACARTKPNRIADEFKKQTAELPKSTEVERLVIQRVGQSLFRDALLDFWQGKCCATGLDVPALLRASHIRPWSRCESDEQRLDVFNGLLLAPHLDALFDGGWITFSDSGEGRVSSALGQAHREQLSLVAPIKIEGLRAEHRAYLEFHRSTLWRQ